MATPNPRCCVCSRPIPLGAHTIPGHGLAHLTCQEFARSVENDLHPGQWFGLLEDVSVDESVRGRGHATALVRHVMEEARRRKCYKLIATSRDERTRVHDLYRRLGFEEWGREFRLNFGHPGVG